MGGMEGNLEGVSVPVPGEEGVGRAAGSSRGGSRGQRVAAERR